MTEIETALDAWGLSGNEIRVYSALLELGEASALRISEVTGIGRTTLYGILKSLIQKGAAGSTVKEKVTYFYAAKPQVLRDLLKERENLLERALPTLINRMGIIGKRPKIEFYEGPKGIDAIHQDVLSTAKQILAYGSYAVTGKVAKYQALDFRKRRIKLKIPLFAITDESVKEIEFLKEKEYRRLTKIYLNSSLSEIPTWTYIYENKVAVLSFEKEQFFGFIIESSSLATKERFLFNTLMKQTKPLQ
jgi:sugar-specific transcriptional regulator TrmB